MGLLAFFVIMFGMFLLMSLSGKKVAKDKRKEHIEGKFGTNPLKKSIEISENVDNYHNTFGETEGIDAVTWNDLSMDKVFARINNCDSSIGEELLYHKLRQCDTAKEEDELLEKRISYWKENPKKRMDMEYLLSDLGKNESAYYIPSYLDCVSEFKMPEIKRYRLQQILLLFSLLAIPLTRDIRAVTVFAVLFLFNIMTYVIAKSKYEVELEMLGTVAFLIQAASHIARDYEQDGICDGLGEKVKLFGKISRGVVALQRQKTLQYSGDPFAIFQDYLIGATMWHLISYDKIMKKLEQCVPEYLDIYKIVGELDASISIASFRESVPYVALPEFEKDRQLKFTELYHPLLEHPVSNSMELEKSCIITGSNASGKSTFIKAVAVNLILAQSIHTVTAKSICLPRMHVITSMAVADDILAGESYFIKEIKYLKRIIDSLEKDKITFCAIDEILRGTNTEERIAASKAILDYLSTKNCISFVASHDKELTDGWNDSYVNYHFSEDIGEEDIVFDYLLKEGPATSKNAIKLLEFVSFPKSIITAAKQRVHEEV